MQGMPCIMSRTSNRHMPSVSVVIPCYNAEAYIGEAIATALSESYERKEIIVVDDGSTDNSIETVKAFGERIHLIETSHAGGCAARNAGLAESRGEYIKWLDADDLLSGDCLERQVKACESGCDVAYGDWEGRELINGEWITISRCQAPLPDDVVAGLIAGFWCPPHCFLMKKSRIRTIGGWDEKLACMQDVDLVLRLSLAGCSFHYVAGLCAIRRKRSEDSVSTADPLEFSRHILRVVGRTEDNLRRRGELNEDRVKALLACYQGLPSQFVNVDENAFNEVFLRMERLDPQFIPTHKPSRLFRGWCALFGFKSAELWAARKRGIKHELLALALSKKREPSGNGRSI